MAEPEYKRTFSRTTAPYMQAVSIVECDDVYEARKSTTLQLNRNCANVEHLPEFKSVRRIHCELCKDWLKPISQLPKLEHVQFTLPKSDEIPSLKSLEGIRTLVLLCNRHQTNLNFLRGLTTVRSLCISEAEGVTSLQPLAKLSNLQELYIDGKMSGTGKFQSLAPLSKLTDLRSAELLLRSESAKPLRHLLPLSRLEYLFLGASFRKLEDELDLLVQSLPRLKSIEFNGGMKWPRKSR